MPLPTILTKGSLVSNETLNQEKLKNIVAIDHVIEWVKSRINKTGMENRILILKSDTGSGKSTAVPPYLYKNFWENKKGNIVCMQPSRLTTMSITKDVAFGGFYPFMRLGETIGWSTGPNKLKPSKGGVLYSTYGIVRRQITSLDDDDFMKLYRFIIIDEVHKRSLDIDIIIYMMKIFMERNKHKKECPFLILTSATFIPEHYTRYFGINSGDKSDSSSNIIRVTGFAFPKKTFWNLGNVSNYIKSATEKAVTFHNKYPNDDPHKSDLLIFLPGGFEMKQVAKGLFIENEKLALADKPVYMVLLIESKSQRENTVDYRAMMAKPETLKIFIKNKEYKPLRRIILSTSVAETGLTIDTLKAVIDCGWNRSKEFNPSFDISGVITKPAAQSSVLQRKGRAGRKFPGEFYPLYDENTFNLLQKIQFPDIIKEDTSPIALNIINEQIKKKISNGSPNPIFCNCDIDMVDNPSADSWHLVMEKLYMLGFINIVENKLQNDNLAKYSQGITLTEIGKIAQEFAKVTPEQIKMILASYAWDVAPLDIITIAAYLSMDIRDFKIPMKEIDWVEIYKDGLPTDVVKNSKIKIHDSSNEIYRYKLLIADDFIDGLFLFTAIMNIVRSSNPKSVINNLINSALRWNIKYTSILLFIQIRDDIVENCINAKLNVFTGIRLESVVKEEFLNFITKIKYCIYEGYKLNTCTYDYEANNYISDHGLIKIIIPNMFSHTQYKMAQERKYGLTYKNRPKKILFKSLEMKSNPKTGIYKVTSSRSSTIDGYIQIDDDFV